MALPTLDITGNTTKDVTLRFSQAGTAVANGTVVANKPKYENGQIVRGQDGHPVNDGVLFMPFTAFGTNAEALAEAGQGASVRLIGSLETDQWKDRETGEKRSMTKLKVDFARVFPRRDRKSQQGYQQAPPQGGQQGGWGSAPESWGSPQPAQPPF